MTNNMIDMAVATCMEICLARKKPMFALFTALISQGCFQSILYIFIHNLSPKQSDCGHFVKKKPRKPLRFYSNVISLSKILC